MSSAICFNLDQSKIVLSGNGLKMKGKSFFSLMENSMGKGAIVCDKK